MNERPRFYDYFGETRDKDCLRNMRTKKKEKIVYDRKCKTCGNKMDGLDTVCNGYRCIPQSVQRGGTCGKYNGEI